MTSVFRLQYILSYSLLGQRTFALSICVIGEVYNCNNDYNNENTREGSKVIVSAFVCIVFVEMFPFSL